MLKKIKVAHETWVRETLKLHKQSNAPVFFAFRVDTGTQFCQSVIGCHFSSFNNDQPKTEEEAELIGDFAQSFQDYNDIWDEIESKNRVLAQLEFDKQISELNEQGFLVYAVKRKEQWKSSNIENPFDVTMNYILVLSKDNPLVRRKDDEIEYLMQFNGQIKKEFTNFIPVMRATSSLKLA